MIDSCNYEASCLLGLVWGEGQACDRWWQASLPMPCSTCPFLLPRRLRLHSVLWSKKPSACSSTNNATACQQAVAAPLTVATATMVNRLEALQAQCLSWPGPLAATLYVPLSAEEGKDLAASAASGTLASALAKAQEVFNW